MPLHGLQFSIVGAACGEISQALVLLALATSAPAQKTIAIARICDSDVRMSKLVIRMVRAAKVGQAPWRSPSTQSCRWRPAHSAGFPIDSQLRSRLLMARAFI